MNKTAWTQDELTRIGQGDELQLASLKPDGSLSNKVIVWVVRHGDDLYVRCGNGRTGPWFRGTLASHQGRIWASGVENNVTFEAGDDSLGDTLDAAYKTKYRRYSSTYIDGVTAPKARAATLKLLPR